MICAEPLTHVAYGPCGHRDACVECVARLRFVMDDERCVICQQQCPSMFATRAMGDYTETIGSEAFAELPRRAREGRELHHDKKLNIFFDDLAVCRKVEQLRGLSCSVCAATGLGSLKQLKAHLREAHDRFFCEVCLEGRKVFVSQQVTYSRQSLDKHKRGAAGDADAPLGGFAGHPACRFCRKNFYDEGALFHHMQSAHETCHLCRRNAPETFVYYRDYDELERHYTTAHHPCLHPECLAKKFVVFQSPQELKNHEGLEHGRAMTKAERKEALRVHVEFSTNGGVGGGGERRRTRGRAGNQPRDPRGHPGAAAEDDRRRREARETGCARGGGRGPRRRAQLEAVLRASRLEDGGASMPRPPSMDEFPDLRAGGGGSSSRGGGGKLVAGAGPDAAARARRRGRVRRARRRRGGLPVVVLPRRGITAGSPDRADAKAAGAHAGAARARRGAPRGEAGGSRGGARGGERRRRRPPRARGPPAPAPGRLPEPPWGRGLPLRGLASGLVRVVRLRARAPRCPPRTSSR